MREHDQVKVLISEYRALALPQRVPPQAEPIVVNHGRVRRDEYSRRLRSIARDSRLLWRVAHGLRRFDPTRKKPAESDAPASSANPRNKVPRDAQRWSSVLRAEMERVGSDGAPQ
jgi:hypothetical protein